MALETLILGAVASLVVAVAGMIIKKFYFDARNRLRVEVQAFRAKTSESVKKIVEESLNAKQQYFGAVRTVVGCKGYASVTITNIGKKKIVGVTAMSPVFDLIWQLDDGDEIVDLQHERPFVVGDIQPKRSRVIHLWCQADMSDFDFGPLKKKLIRISADELDSMRWGFPMPRYLRKKHGMRFLWLLNILAYSGVAISLYFGWMR